MYSRHYDLSPMEGRGATSEGIPRDGEGGDRRDAAKLLMWSLNAWYKGQQQHEGQAIAGARKKLHRLRTKTKAQEDEKSLYHNEWSTDLSLDQPSYGSVLLQIQEANVEAEGACDFVRKSCDIITSTIVITIVLGSFVALPVGMISIGVKYLNECPVQPKIPIYLLVGGCFGLLKLLSMLWKQVRSRRYERLDEIMDEDDGNGDVIMSKSSRFSEAVLSLFLFIWFIFGNYWVLGIYKPHFQLLLHEPSNWCDKTVYMFAFIQICICYGLMGLIAIIMCILGMCHRCTADKS